jgi:hypothetical protein
MPTIKQSSFLTTSAIAMVVSMSAFATAQEQNKNQDQDTGWIGVVTTDNTLIRCGANESYYPITKSKLGDLVLVQGRHQDWLQVETSGDVFTECVGYIKYPANDAAVFALSDKTGNALSDLEVLAKNIESDELYRSWRPILRLQEGDAVTVVHTETTKPGTLHRESYVVHTVKMPAGGKGWIDASFIQEASKEQVALFYGEPEKTIDTTIEQIVVVATESKTNEVISVGVSLEPSVSAKANNNVAVVETKTLKPLSLVELEAAWKKITAEPVMGAEVSQLRDMYKELLIADNEDIVLAQVAGNRIKQLEVWGGLQAQRVRIEALRMNLGEQSEEVNEFQTVMEMNGEYALIGKLALSNTFDGRLRPLMYRIQDQKSGRTLGYMPADDDFELSGLIGQYIGVAGKATWNPTWRVVVVEGSRYDLLSPTTAIVSPDIQ